MKSDWHCKRGEKTKTSMAVIRILKSKVYELTSIKAPNQLLKEEVEKTKNIKIDGDIPDFFPDYHNTEQPKIIKHESNIPKKSWADIYPNPAVNRREQQAEKVTVNDNSLNW